MSDKNKQYSNRSIGVQHKREVIELLGYVIP
jgi:hypothetical protein